MGDAAFDRAVINHLERPLSSDINQAQSEIARTIRELARGLFLPHNTSPQSASTSFQAASGFLGDGFFAVAGGNLVHTLRAGMGFIFNASLTASSIGGIAKVDDLSPYYPVYLANPQTITSPAQPSTGQERVDIIEVALDRRLQDASSRDVFDPGSGAFVPTSVQKTLSYALDGRVGTVTTPSDSTTGISLKAGTPQAANTYSASGGTAGVPPTTAGYVRIAVILINDSGMVTQDLVRDDRFLLGHNGVLPFGFDLAQVPGTNDTFTIATFPPAAAGFKFAAHQVASPSNGGSVRCYVFGGRIKTNGGAIANAMCKAGSVANANRLVRMTGLSSGSITSTQQGQLLGAGTTNFLAAVGQEYLSWDMDATRTIDSGDSTDSTRIFHVTGLCSPRS